MRHPLIITLFLFFLATHLHAASPSPTSPSPAPPRLTTDLSGPCKFLRKDLPDAQLPATSDTDWDSITIPHTWNAQDGQDGGGNYYRGIGWYRKHITLDQPLQAKTVYLHFQGANRTTVAYVNGKEVGSHTGGFAAFAFDITHALKPGDNLIAIKVDNAHNPNSPPLSADFTFFGGIYRKLSLITVPQQHFSIADLSTRGVRIYTTLNDTNPAARTAEIKLQANLLNTSDKPRDMKWSATITEGDHTLVTSSEETPITLQPGANSFSRTLTLKNPHLWNGRKDPHLYRLTLTLTADGKPVDRISLPLGVRTMSVDPKRGFLLNGQPYDLHGVNRHQDWWNKGWAISEKEMDADIAIIKEMGCTAVRLAHYQHHDYFYDLCDREGIVVWAELALVNNITNSPEFTANSAQQLRQLIRQNMHHPSIAMWSLCNEITLKSGPSPWALIADLNKIAKEEDPTRLTVQAIVGGGPSKQVTDIWAFNRYFGWYGSGKPGEVVGFIAKKSGSFAMSEYGAGAGFTIHNENPRRMDHSEEYQCLFHEAYWKAMKDQPKVWGKFIWVYADFAADHRKEGEQQGRNDKGTVSADRSVKKDVFYFYKANWAVGADYEPTLHICSRRFPVRGLQKITVKAYSNADQVTLFVNGSEVGKATNDTGIFTWENVTLREGPNQVEARATIHGKPLTDTVTWTYKPNAPTEIGTSKKPAPTTGLGH